MRLLKQSTAYTLMVLMVDSSDHVTGKTGLTLSITASKAGGAFASTSPTVTDRGSGWYAVALSATDTGTLGDLALHVTATGADPTDLLCQVRANILGDTLPVNVTQVNGNPAGYDGTAQAGTATTITLAASDAAGANAYVDRALSIVGGTGAGQSRYVTAYNSSTKVATVHRAWDTTPDATSTYAIDPTRAGLAYSVSDKAGYSLSGTQSFNNAGQTSNLPADVKAILGAASAGVAGYVGVDWSHVNAPATAVSLSGTTISTAQAVASVSGNVAGNVSGSVAGSVGSLATQAKADVAGAVWDASGASHVTAGTFGARLDVTVSTRLDAGSYSAPPSVAAIVAGVWNEPHASHTTAGTFGYYLDSAVSAVSSGGLTAGQLASAIWDEPASSHVTAGTFGARFDASISSRLDAGSYSAPPSSAAVASAVWNEPKSSHATAGTFGAYLDAAVSSRLATSGYTAPLSTAQVSAAVWDVAQSSHKSAGTFGAYLDSAVSGVSTGGISATQIATAVWQDPTAGSDFGAAGSIGALLAANVDAKVSTRAATGDAMTLTTAERSAVADAFLDRADGVETGETPRQWMRKVRAVLMGVSTAAGIFKRKDKTTTSLTVTLDGNGARTDVLDGSN